MSRLKQPIWKSIPGYESRYEVSNTGRVRSITITGNGHKPRELKQRSSHPFGYKYVGLHSENGKGEVIAIHRLVLLTFIGPCPEGHLCNHKDNNPSNNSLYNLEWVTYSGNVQHMINSRRENPPKGERCATSKLTSAQVEEIKNRLQKGERPTDIANEFKISRPTICDVRYNRTWKHL